MLWSAFNRNRATSVAGVGEGETLDSCRSWVRSHQLSFAVNYENNIPSVRIGEAVDTVEPRRRV